jgi:uncharacterized protein (DUF2384 family)
MSARASIEVPILSEATEEAIQVAARKSYDNYRRLVERTVDVFGDELIASRWLSMPSSDFGGKVPIQVAQSVDYDASELDRIFEPIFVHMEHGIYS